LHSGCFQVVDDLCFFDAGETVKRFYLDDDRAEADEVRAVARVENCAAIRHWKHNLAAVRDTTRHKLFLKRFLVNSFEKSVP